MVSRRQTMQRNFTEISILKFVNELRVFILVVLIPDVELSDYEPDDSAQYDDDSKGQIRSLI